MRPRDDQKIPQLFTATLGLVAKVGLSGLTVPQLAKASKVATGTVYVYFKDKDDLINALYREVKYRFQDAFFAGFDPSRPVKESLRKLWDHGLRYMAAHYEEQIFLQQYSISPYRRADDMTAYAQKMMAPLRDILRAGQEQGLVKSDKERLIVPLLMGFMSQAAEAARHDPSLLGKAALDKSFRFFWDAIKE
ncbi:MAG TPA: TetR/AcrR family transcriptional regulator [Dinghuibacter sp.]|uniref:TetR/AcrR family transcriptional regulator n=1 Tax=Dinghuibacter sp. TaxID=2024697 RepID=UPI002B7FC64B|nr:TetR/AcrR family transcriptional regulator [Dinghuibacter sp.]HTJ10830.1 TetR/AcrR family transcriptional regulator [Dinghuibacter sp.]